MPLAGRADRIPPRAHFIFPKGWQGEALRMRTRICRCMDQGRAQGKPLRKMVRFHAWRWSGRHYKADPFQPILFKASTILRIFRMWRKGGRTPAALAFHYWGGNRKASMGQVIELSKVLLASETRSFSAACRTLKAPSATHWAYRKAMPPRLKAALAALLAHRRRGHALEPTARKLLEEVAK